MGDPPVSISRIGREKPVMNEGGYLLYRSANKLREPLIVAQLLEEAMTADYDQLSPEEVQTVYFTILFSQEEQGFRRRGSVDRGDVSEERNPSWLGDRMRHGCRICWEEDWFGAWFILVLLLRPTGTKLPTSGKLGFLRIEIWSSR